MKLFLKSVAQGMGPVGLAAVGAVALVVGTPRGRKALRSLAVSVVAATMNAADGVRAMVGNTRAGLSEIVREADARRKSHTPSPAALVERSEPVHAAPVLS